MRTFILILLLHILFLIQLQTSSAQPQVTYTGGDCRGNDTITSNTTYHANILTLLTNLHSFSSFNKFSLSSVGNTTDRVNGFYLCRPDVSPATCETCINATIGTITQYCLGVKSAVIWYEECMIQYTNKSVAPIDANATYPWDFWFDKWNVSQPDVFPSLLNKTMIRLISLAISADNLQPFFAYGKENYTAFETLYGMVFCRPDISAKQCESCLMVALKRIPTCCEFASWTIIMQPSCQLRYDTAPFIFSSDVPPLDLSPTLASPPSLAPAPES